MIFVLDSFFAGGAAWYGVLLVADGGAAWYGTLFASGGGAALGGTLPVTLFPQLEQNDISSLVVHPAKK